MTLYRKAPPGYLELEEVCARFKMSRQNFYQSGLADFLDSWQTKPNTPRFYSEKDVGMLNHWIFTRQGLIVLGVMKKNDPLKPDFNLEAFFQEGEHDYNCPKCGGPAIIDRPYEDESRVWCPDCGKSEVKDEEFNLPEVTKGEGIPQDAKYGLWNAVTQQWTGDWYFDDKAAAVAADEECRNSWLKFVVIGINDTDDSWLDEDDSSDITDTKEN